MTTRKTIRLPTAVLKFATDVTYQRKISDSTIQPTTTSPAPTLTHRFARGSAGAYRTSNPKAGKRRTTAPTQRPTTARTPSAPPPGPTFEATSRIAPARPTMIATERPIETGKRIHHGRVSFAS